MDTDDGQQIRMWMTQSVIGKQGQERGMIVVGAIGVKDVWSSGWIWSTVTLMMPCQREPLRSLPGLTRLAARGLREEETKMSESGVRAKSGSEGCSSGV